MPMQRRSNASSSLIIHRLSSRPLSSRRAKPKPPHAIPIPLHHTLTFFLWIIANTKEHAFVSRDFFVFAYAAGLILYLVSEVCKNSG